MKPISRIKALSLLLLAAAVFVSGYVLWGIKWPQGSNVGYVVNPNTAQVSNELAAVASAAGSWSSINPSGLRFFYAGATGATNYGYDGQNEVCWRNQGANGILATTYAWSSGSTMVEVDLVFNDGYPWSTSGASYDVETVALHEFGHWVGLDHTSSGIMTPAYSGLQRTIDSDARAGFIAMYGSGSSPLIEVNPGSLSYEGSGQKTFQVRNSGSGTLTYAIGVDRAWLSVNPASGSSTGAWNTVTVSVSASGLSSGTYYGTVSVSSSGAPNSPQSVGISLTIARDQPPTVKITQPANGATVSSVVDVWVDAADDLGVQKIDYYVDGAFKFSDPSEPYSYSWDTTKTSNGAHVLKAVATDTAGQTAADEKTVTVRNFILTIRAGTGGTTDPSPGTYVYGAGANATVRAAANAGFRFGNWSEDASGTANPIAIVMNADKAITANFVRQYTLTISAGAGGTTNPAPGSYLHDEGSSVTVTAAPQTKFRFLSWSGDGAGAANPIVVVMSSDKAVTALFMRQYTLTISAGAGGTTNPAPGSYIYDEGSNVTITALPEAKFRFASWNGNAQGAANPLAVAMNGDHSIGADFIRIIYPPANLTGRKVLNRSLTQAEYINLLTWEANPDNDGVNLVYYRIYLSAGESLSKIADLPPNRFSFEHRRAEKNTVYNYIIVAVNDEGREGDPGTLTIR